MGSLSNVNILFFDAYDTVENGQQPINYNGAVPYDTEIFDGIDLFVIEEISYGRYVVKENSNKELLKQLISNYNHYKLRNYK